MKRRVSWRNKLFSVGMIVIFVLFIVACGHDDDFRNQIKETAPTITSADSTVFTVGTAGTFTVTTTGNPTPTLTQTGALPSGLTFNTTTGVLSGTPAAGTNGAYPLTITASNGVSPTATQNFTLTVNAASAATSWPAGVKQSGTNAYDYAIGMVKDNAGNIYITGYTTGNLDGYVNSGDPYDYDIYLIKYNASGVKLWTKMIQSSGRDDRPFGIAYDGTDSIYITGYSTGDLDGNNPGHNECMFVAKFSTDGANPWVKMYETSVTAKGYSLACSGGYVFLTGTSQNDANGFDLFLAKLNDAGVVQWKKYYGGTGYECGQAIALDASGNIYVTGTSDKMILYKFDASGEKLWDKANVSYLNGMAIALDSSANIYITGRTISAENGYLVKYNTSGVFQWDKPITALADSGNAVALDSAGNIYVAGSTRGNLDGELNLGSYDGFLIKYNAAGTRQWTKLLGSVALDGFNAMVLESDAYIFVFGHTEGSLPGNSSLGSLDFFIAQYDSSGNL